MDPLIVFSGPPPLLVARALDAAGHPWQVVSSIFEVEGGEPQGGWSGAVVSVAPPGESGPGLTECLAFCRALRSRELPLRPVLLIVPAEMLSGLAFEDDLFDDFVVSGASGSELEARLHRLLGLGAGQKPDVISYGPLALNLETYQAVLAGRPLDLTFMEYELLRFLAARPGKVFTREVLLSRVWGYEYYGGARTVDVHVRRLRAKFGEEHAHLIDTVRSVGYRFGSLRWHPTERA
jgi:DNA-binding response OmpR family regulator